MRAALLATMLLTAICAHARTPDKPPMEQQVLIWRMVGPMHTGPDGPTEPADRVIRDRKDFDRLWKRAYATSRPAREVPPIDFSREMVILLSLGGFGPVGTDIVGERAIEYDDFVRVTYSVVSAGKNCVTLPSFAAVVWVLRTKRIDKPVSFAKERVTLECK